MKPHAFGRRHGSSRGEWVDQPGRIDRSGRGVADEMVTVDDVDMDDRHIEAGQCPDERLDADDERQPLVSPPCEQRQSYRQL